MSQALHNIHTSWTFWYAPRGKNSIVTRKNSEKYENQLKNLGTFQTIEDFFSLYCYFKRPSEIPSDHKLMLFRSDKKPLWEEYPDGGTWVVAMKRKDEEDLNKKWEQLLFACIGEQFENTQIIGVVLSKRQKRNLLEIWIENSLDEEVKVSIGERLRKILDMDYQNLTFYFKKHQESLQDQSLFKGIEKYTFKTTPVETPVVTPLQQSRKESLQQNEQIQENLNNFKL